MKDTGRLATSSLSRQGNHKVKGCEAFLMSLLGEPTFTPPYPDDDKDEMKLKFQKLDGVRFINAGSLIQSSMGAIKQLCWRDPGRLPGVAAYQFQDDWDGDLRYANLDDNCYVRKAENGEKARAQSTGTRYVKHSKNVFENWCRKCLHPRCTDWRSGELSLPDNAVVQAAAVWNGSEDGNNPRAMPALGVVSGKWHLSNSSIL